MVDGDEIHSNGGDIDVEEEITDDVPIARADQPKKSRQ